MPAAWLQIDPLAMDDALGGGDGSNLWHQQAEASGQQGAPLGTQPMDVPSKGAATMQGSSSLGGGDVKVRFNGRLLLSMHCCVTRLGGGQGMPHL
jgi:hypothetical protein